MLNPELDAERVRSLIQSKQEWVLLRLLFK
jgi:hypothetical protein